MDALESIEDYQGPDRRKHFQNVWTAGSIFASTTSILSLLSMLVGGVWFAARIDLATQEIPSLIRTSNDRALRITSLEIKQQYTDARYVEIMAQLTDINRKIDNLRESKNEVYRTPIK